MLGIIIINHTYLNNRASLVRIWATLELLKIFIVKHSLRLILSMHNNAHTIKTTPNIMNNYQNDELPEVLVKQGLNKEYRRCGNLKFGNNVSFEGFNLHKYYVVTIAYICRWR